MAPQKPEIAGLDGDSLGRQRLRDCIGPGIALGRLQAPDQEVDLDGFEAGNLDIEVDLDLAEKF